MAVMGKFRSDLLITCMIDGNFGNVSVVVLGCLPFSQKIRKFRFEVKWKSNFPEIFSEIVDNLQR